MKRCLLFLLLGLAPLLLAGPGRTADDSKKTPGLGLKAAQKEYLALEPILVVVGLTNDTVRAIPAVVGDAKGDATLSFEIKPAVKPRDKAKPLPVEAARSSGKLARLFDLLEWYQFPDQGEFTVKAVIKQGQATVTSEPITVKLTRPDKKDAEWGPVDRLHHIPWSNYVTDAFCGDTFDVVKRWPDSKLAKYCHYYNGLHHQHKKEYDKAIASLKVVVEKHPDFLLAPDADDAIHQCLIALGKKSEAAKHREEKWTRRLKDPHGRFLGIGFDEPRQK